MNVHSYLKQLSIRLTEEFQDVFDIWKQWIWLKLGSPSNGTYMSTWFILYMDWEDDLPFEDRMSNLQDAIVDSVIGRAQTTDQLL